jgi:flagellar biogenesis protein FliO
MRALAINITLLAELISLCQQNLEAISKILFLLGVLGALAWYFKDFHAKAQRSQRKIREIRAALHL